MLVFKQWLTEGIAQLSYLVGDDQTHTAAVIDPRPDVDIYLDAAQEEGLSITHIFETHIHADFMSGARELAARVGSAAIYASGEGDPTYGFDLEQLSDGDSFEFGETILRARFTPGHTPEHMSYELCRSAQPDRPVAVFTGDSVFVGSIGRPDLLGDDETEGLVEQLFHTVRDYFLKLEDDIILYPGHGKGSACGASIGDRLSSTMGYERTHNAYLQFRELDDFKEKVLSGAPPAPAHYPRLKKLNAAGPEVLGAGPVVPALAPARFAAALDDAEDPQLIDSRHMLSFGGGHIPGAINLGARKEEISVYGGWTIDPDRPVLLVLEDDTRRNEVVTLLIRTGITRFAGYLAGGMSAWANHGGPLQTTPQMHAAEVAKCGDELQVLDVRQDDEFASGHVPGAVHQFVPRLLEEAPMIDLDRPVVTYCATGYRASLASSLLQRAGCRDVRNLPGSWKAWQAAGLPVEA